MRERACTHARLERAAVRALTRARSHGLEQRLFKERAREWGGEGGGRRGETGERRQGLFITPLDMPDSAFEGAQEVVPRIHA